MVNSEEINEKIRSYLSRHIRNQEVGGEVDLFDSNLINSMFAMQLVLFIEKEFTIKIENEDLNFDNFRTINAIIHLVGQKLQVVTDASNETAINFE